MLDWIMDHYWIIRRDGFALRISQLTILAAAPPTDQKKCKDTKQSTAQKKHRNNNDNKMSRNKDMKQLAADFVPGFTTVICAKGKEAKEHSGNRFLRYLVTTNLKAYAACSNKLQRSCIVSRILKMIRMEGAFVRQDIHGVWCDVGDRTAREKIGQSLRDLLHTQYKSSAKAKANKRRRRSVKPSDPRPSSPVLSVPFPIAEVSFSTDEEEEEEEVTASSATITATPAMEQGAELTLKDLEPLPISQALVNVDFNNLSHCSVVSEHSEFQEAMDGMYQFQFSSSEKECV